MRSARESFDGHQLRVQIIDNGSSDDSLVVLRRELADSKIVALPENLGYAAACNKALENCSEDFIVFSNSDVVYHPNALSQMLRCIQRNTRVGVLGLQQVYANGKWQRSYGLLPGLRAALSDVLGLTFLHRAFHSFFFSESAPSSTQQTEAKCFDVDYVDGAVLCVRRSAFAEIAGFDSSYFFFGEDIDLCIRMRSKSWRVAFCPSARATHLRGATRKTNVAHDMKVLALNESARIRIHRSYSSAFFVKLATALEAMYYAELWLLRSVLSMVVSGPGRDLQRQKADLCKHLSVVCAQELENIE